MWVLRLRLRCSPRLPSRSAESMESTGSRTATSPSDACARPSRASACALYPARALIPAGCLRRTRAQREGKAGWPTRVSALRRGQCGFLSEVSMRDRKSDSWRRNEGTERQSISRFSADPRSPLTPSQTRLLGTLLLTAVRPVRRPVVAMPMASFGFKQRLLRERGSYPMIATRCCDPCIPCEPSNTRSNEPSRRAVTLK